MDDWTAREADAAAHEERWGADSIQRKFEAVGLRKRSGTRPYTDYGADEDCHILWRYTWKAGRDNHETAVFECNSGSREDADRQLLKHLYSLGLSGTITKFADAQAVLIDLDVDVDLDGGRVDGASLLPILDLAALSNVRAKAVAFVIERLAPAGEVTLFTGPGSAGKSLLGQQLCTVSAGALGSCLGLAVAAGPAIYATCEDTAEHLHFRQERLCEALNVPMVSLADKLHLVSLRGELDNELEGRDEKGNYSPSAAYDRLAATIKATGAKLVVLDNVAHLFSGNENDRHDVTQFVNLLNRLARDTGAAVLLIGHPPKSSNPLAVAHDYSGSTAWLNAVRSQIKIDTPRDADGSVLDRDARVLTIGKANYAPKGDGINFRWHDWAFVRDDDLPTDTRAEIDKVIRANGENDAFLRCLRARTEQGAGREVGPAPGPNYAPSQFEGMPEAKGYKKAVLKRAMDRLFAIGKIESATVERPGKSGQKTIIFEVPEPSPNASRTPFPNPPEPPPERPRTHTHISKDISGAGPDGPPPLDDDDLDWSTDGEASE